MSAGGVPARSANEFQEVSAGRGPPTAKRRFAAPRAMCVSGYTPDRRSREPSRESPFASRPTSDARRGPGSRRRGPRRSANGRAFAAPVGQPDGRLDVDVARHAASARRRRAERSRAGAGGHRARPPAGRAAARSGPSPRITTSSASAAPARCDAAARAQQPIVALDRNQPADREHRRCPQAELPPAGRDPRPRAARPVRRTARQRLDGADGSGRRPRARRTAPAARR